MVFTQKAYIVGILLQVAAKEKKRKFNLINKTRDLVRKGKT